MVSLQNRKYWLESKTTLTFQPKWRGKKQQKEGNLWPKVGGMKLKNQLKNIGAVLGEFGYFA